MVKLTSISTKPTQRVIRLIIAPPGGILMLGVLKIGLKARGGWVDFSLNGS